ncbi:hypothetical protein HDU98_011625 [Podochytrium sp. JEL0797]|nr:hypothetical protein HDU98_011625 [Podochytrium sp. JEL0797]
MDPQQTSTSMNKSSRVKLIIPPNLLPFTSCTSASRLYATLDTETKARMSVINAFAYSPDAFLHRYHVHGIVGFGSNGAVLAAQDMLSERCDPVAIKIIYKRAKGPQETPDEIAALRVLNDTVSHPSILHSLASWEDSCHFYLVTELFGSNWLVNDPQPLQPLHFKTIRYDTPHVHTMSVSSGASDLWAYTFALRAHLRKSNHRTTVPSTLIKHLFRETAKAVLAMHAAGFVHGDVKLENVLCQQTASGILPSVMLVDYGHMKHVQEGIKRYGTQEVSPPEFLSDSPFLASGCIDGRRADVFALGMLLYTLFDETGGLPDAVERAGRGEVGFEWLKAVDSGRFPFERRVEGHPMWDLMDSMCRVVPEERLDMEGVLGHSWLL